jgi:hypothetical protein
MQQCCLKLSNWIISIYKAVIDLLLVEHCFQIENLALLLSVSDFLFNVTACSTGNKSIIAYHSRLKRYWLIDRLPIALRPAWESFTYMGTSPLPMKGLCSVLRAFEQGGIFIVPQVLWQKATSSRVIVSCIVKYYLTTGDTIEITPYAHIIHVRFIVYRRKNGCLWFDIKSKPLVENE